MRSNKNAWSSTRFEPIGLEREEALGEMACSTEHFFLLNAGIAAARWRPAAFAAYGGWEVGAAEPLNRLAVLADAVGDWLWHVPPRSEAALQYGAARVRRDLERGDEQAAAWKAAYLTHFVIDPLAVAHSWLDFFGEREDFPSPEALHAVHDPVENVIADHLDRVPALALPAGEFGAMYRAALRRSYALGEQAYQRFQVAGEATPRGEDYLDLLVAGIENSAPVVGAFFDALAEGGVELVPDELVERRTARWPSKLWLDWGADRLEAELFEPQTTTRLKAALGWHGRNVFFDRAGLDPAAAEDYAAYQADRRDWRQEYLVGELGYGAGGRG